MSRREIDGAPGALRFRHADGSPYGEAQSPLLIDLYHELHRALRFLGFGETQLRRGLERLRRERADDPVAPDLESLLRRALSLWWLEPKRRMRPRARSARK